MVDYCSTSLLRKKQKQSDSLHVFECINLSLCATTSQSCSCNVPLQRTHNIGYICLLRLDVLQEWINCISTAPHQYGITWNAEMCNARKDLTPDGVHTDRTNCMKTVKQKIQVIGLAYSTFVF